MTGLERGALWLAQAVPTPPTDQPYDPNDVTPGPIGFFATVFLFLAVGVIAMSLMRRSARVQERWAIREQLEREAAEEDARLEAQSSAGDTATNAADGESTVNRDATDDQTKTGS